MPKDSLGQGTQGIPITYVPARNTIFLSYAMAWAEVLECSDVFIGVNAIDYSGYPDCRPEFIAAFEKMANLATKAGVEGRTRLRIHTPLKQLDKAGIVTMAKEVGVDFALTHSCYDPDPSGRSCGHCDSCLLRQKGFREAGLDDVRPLDRGVVGPVQHRPCVLVVVFAPGDHGQRVTGPDGVRGRLAGSLLLLRGLRDRR